jgi:hypothetical protein
MTAQPAPSHPPAARWSAEQAYAWYNARPWLVGCNYTPRTAINQLELWQAESFDPDTIRQELAWAANLGFTSLRVFLHDLVYFQNPQAFRARVDTFLALAARHKIGILFVHFDSVWYPFPYLGKQRAPEPGVHNSFWVQSPGVPVLQDPAQFDRLQPYVTDLIAHFRDDQRIHGWDLWNEPENSNPNSYGPCDLGDQKADLVLPLLQKTFAWARAANPTQPLTSGIWSGDWTTLNALQQCQLDASDVISFHNYGPAPDLATRIAQLQRFARPLLCTEYMARGTGSTFAAALPILKHNRVAAYNWGFVQGKTQTHLPWDSWRTPYTAAEPLWFHEILRPNGAPYNPEEVALIQSLTHP